MPTPKLFEPLTVGSLTLANRIVIAPMCQYSAKDGCMSDWHVMHLGHLAMSGAALLTIEATAVLPEGRISHADVGLWDDHTEAAIAKALSSVRAWSDMPIAIQLAHAGRKASTEVPWRGGKQLLPDHANGWQTRRPVRHSVRHARPCTARAGPRWHDADPRRLRCGGTALDATGHRRRADPRRPRLSPAPVPVAAVEPAR